MKSFDDMSEPERVAELLKMLVRAAEGGDRRTQQFLRQTLGVRIDRPAQWARVRVELEGAAPG